MTARSHVQEIAHLVHGYDAGSVTAEEARHAKRCLIDTLGCGVAGARSDVAHRVHAALQTRGRIEEAGMLGRGERATVGEAVLHDATAVRALDFNDTYSGRNNLHPSELVIPLALAIGERDGWIGDRLVREVAVGYDACIRISEAIAPLLPNGWAPNATVGQIAAPALAARWNGLDEATIAHAVAINAINHATLAVVFKEGLSMAKSMASALVVQAGVDAARYAAHGVTGPMRVFEGKSGFVEMVGKEFDPRRLAAGGDASIASIWLKGYPTMFHFHPALEAAVRVARGEPLAADEIAAVEVRAAPSVCRATATPEHWQVTTHDDAQFSMPFGVATTLVHGACTTEQFTDEAVRDRGVQAVLARLTVEPDEELNAGGHPHPAEVAVTLRDGTELRERARYPTGHAQNPLSDEALREKYLRLAAPQLGHEAAEDLHARLAACEAETDLGGILRHLHGSSA